MCLWSCEEGIEEKAENITLRFTAWNRAEPSLGATFTQILLEDGEHDHILAAVHTNEKSSFETSVGDDTEDVRERLEKQQQGAGRRSSEPAGRRIVDEAQLLCRSVQWRDVIQRVWIMDLAA